MNFPKWPVIAEDEISAVDSVLRSGKINYWTGEECKLFEQEFAAFIDVPYAIALANGTLALELALHALGIGPGDEVIVPCRTFIASASCVVARGATPIVVDIDPFSQNLTVETIKPALTAKTKAIIAVHLAGWPCEMDKIMAFAKEHNLKVIEDCAQAHGAKYQGKHVGSFGDIAAFSFCQDKIMTTGGEGGLLVTKDKDLWRKAWSYKDHGKNPEIACARDGSTGFRWVHESFGTNFRMMEMQAAIGRVQLRKLVEWVKIRRRNAQIFAACFKDIPALRTTIPPAEIEHSYYKYYAFVRPENLRSGVDRDKLLQQLVAAGIHCGSGSCGEIYLEKAFVDAGLSPSKRFTNAKKLAATSLMFLVHPTLSEDNIRAMCEIIKSVV